MIRPAPADFEGWQGLLGLILCSFASMDGQIDPPSSAKRLTPDAVRQRAQDETLYLAIDGGRILGCAFLADQADALYIGKLAVHPDAQGRGLGAGFVAAAMEVARARGLSRLRLETRVELTENHAVFTKLGFVQTAQTAHPGYDRPTSITMERPLW